MKTFLIFQLLVCIAALEAGAQIADTRNAERYAIYVGPEIRFLPRFATFYFNTTTVPAAIELQGGDPASIAVMIDNTNFEQAIWSAYTSTNFTFNLPPTEGWHEVWVGFRGPWASSKLEWEWRRLKFDQTPPVLGIANPASSVVTQPMIQLQGYSSEDLESVSCDVSNAAGVRRGEQVLVLHRYFDRTTSEETTNYFQAFDLDLAKGVNTITLHATDRSGNITSTNFTFTLDYSTKTNPPLIKLYWPHDGTQVSSDKFTWRGWVEDPTAEVTATMLDADGNTNTFHGSVERDGKFWIEDIPLLLPTNVLTLIAIDAAGNLRTTNVSVLKSEMRLTIDPVPPDQLHRATVTVSGTISVLDHTVWVNGVKATLHPDGTWIATNVPTTKGGTALFQAAAIPNWDNGGNGHRP